MAFKFENLEVWRDSLELGVLVNEVVADFPREEIYVLSSQLKPAADSVSLNIAEGSTGQSNKEFNRFLGYSIRSAIEVVACIYSLKNVTSYRKNILIKYITHQTNW
jgi:four helix bundle protein